MVGFPFRNDWSTSTIAKLRLGEALRGGRDRVALGEADPDDQVEALPRERRHVRDVVGGGLRLDDAARDPELALGPLEALEGELVEAVVVELARVGDQADLEAGRRCLRLGRGRLVVAAAPGRERGSQDGDRREPGEPERDPLHLCHSPLHRPWAASFCL